MADEIRVTELNVTQVPELFLRILEFPQLPAGNSVMGCACGNGCNIHIQCACPPE